MFQSVAIRSGAKVVCIAVNEDGRRDWATAVNADSDASKALWLLEPTLIGYQLPTIPYNTGVREHLPSFDASGIASTSEMVLEVDPLFTGGVYQGGSKCSMARAL